MSPNAKDLRLYRSQGTGSYLIYRRPLASSAMHLPKLLKTITLSTLSQLYRLIGLP